MSESRRPVSLKHVGPAVRQTHGWSYSSTPLVCVSLVGCVDVGGESPHLFHAFNALSRKCSSPPSAAIPRVVYFVLLTADIMVQCCRSVIRCGSYLSCRKKKTLPSYSCTLSGSPPRKSHSICFTSSRFDYSLTQQAALPPPRVIAEEYRTNIHHPTTCLDGPSGSPSGHAHSDIDSTPPPCNFPSLYLGHNVVSNVALVASSWQRF